MLRILKFYFLYTLSFSVTFYESKNLGINFVSILPNFFVPNCVFSYAAEPFLDHLIVTMSVTTHFPENFVLYFFILDIFKNVHFQKVGLFLFWAFWGFFHSSFIRILFFSNKNSCLFEKVQCKSNACALDKMAGDFRGQKY
jgi:hypothetical protein